MDRRNFIHLGIAGAGAGLLMPTVGLAKAEQKTMAGGVYFTQQNPGRWSKKVGGHLPSIEVDKGNAKVQIVTAHAMNGYKHYIVKHVLLDANYQFLQEKVFNPLEDKAALSVFSLGDYKGTVHALSMCNLHDVWISSAEV